METAETKIVSRKEGARRLLKLARGLRTKVAPAVKRGGVAFDMHLWADSAELSPRLSCGTAACAMGFATVLVPEAGLFIGPESHVVVARRDPLSLDGVYREFALTESEGFHIVSAKKYNRPTLHNVARRIEAQARKMLREARRGAGGQRA